MAMTNAEKQAAWRRRQKEERVRLRELAAEAERVLSDAETDLRDFGGVTPAAIRSAARAQMQERSRDAAALNRLLLALNIEPVGFGVD